MKSIIYYANNDTMGDCTDQECDHFRSWAMNTLEKEFPGYSVEVSDEQSLSTVWTDDDEREDDIEVFCSRLWDDYPWGVTS